MILVGCLDLGEVGTWSHTLPFTCSLSRPIKTVTPGHKNRLFSAASAMLYCTPADGKKKPPQQPTLLSDLPQIPIKELRTLNRERERDCVRLVTAAVLERQFARARRSC